MEIFDKHEYSYSIIGLANFPGRMKESELYKAVQNLEENKIKKILEESKEEIDKGDSYGWTPFMKLVADLSIPTSQLDKKKGYRILNQLLKNGANINLENFLNRSALNFAVRYGDLDMVKFLIKNGADINKKKENPVELALKLRHIEIYDLLKNKSK